MVFELKQTKKAEALFDGWQESLIWSCLQGVMGKLYVDSLEHPRSVMALLGDFCFLAGKPEKELVWYEPEQSGRDFLIMVPQNQEWAALIEDCYGERATRVVRYAIKKEPGVFDREKLQAIADRVPQGYTLKLIDEPLFWHCREIEWCRDWVRQYADYAAYQKHGLGAALVKDGEPVSGAASYSGYQGGIEVEIITREDHRRKGLASICGARLILECLKRDWYPSWDAKNKWSVALAEKLGYHFDHEYPAYEITRAS